MTDPFYENHPRTVYAVTGTNGKTSVVSFIRQLLNALEVQTAVIGTNGFELGNTTTYNGFTTPTPALLDCYFYQMIEARCDTLVMETTSIGLAEDRLHDIEFAGAVFTNFGHDHLDYHATLDAYLEAKLRLFAQIRPHSTIVVSEEGWPANLAKRAAAHGHTLVTVSRSAKSTVCIVRYARHSVGYTFEIVAPSQEPLLIEVPFTEYFQAYNAMLAIIFLNFEGYNLEQLLTAAQQLQAVPGRAERIAEHNGAAIYLDYAHNPQAIHTVLLNLAKQTQHRLVHVMGLEGGRDPSKRAPMIQESLALADITIVTTDSTRTEAARDICAEAYRYTDCEVITNRARAIQSAIERLVPGDVLVITSRGRDTGLHINGATLPYADADVIAKCLNRPELRQTVPDQAQ